MMAALQDVSCALMHGIALMLVLMAILPCRIPQAEGSFMVRRVQQALAIPPSLPSSPYENPHKLVSIALKSALAVVHESHAFARHCSESRAHDLHLLERQAMEDCTELMERASGRLNFAILNFSDVGESSSENGDVAGRLPDVPEDLITNLNVWLSAALSFQAACADGFQFVKYGKCESAMLQRQAQVGAVLQNSLRVVKKLMTKKQKGAKSPAHHRDHERQLSAEEKAEGLPPWVGACDERKLLLASAPAAAAANASAGAIIYDADMVVAQDGSGNASNLTDALSRIPHASAWPQGRTRFVVYIKQGVYNESVEIPSSLANLTLVGDGIGVTVVSGANNVGGGLFNTYRTATVGISADGFMAKDMTFRNTAGPEGYQAVALRAAGDHAVFYRCSFEGYQDTLYALASRQFYRDCIIQGTIDFIFGNAIASFQNCRLQARRPLRGQQNTITAQGRRVELDVSGFSFQNCTLEAAPELTAANFSVSSYLGRPWKDFSRTVFLQCFFDSIIHPAGWLPWNSSNPFTDTVFYGEFQNRGPGSSTADRVPWKGVHSAMNSSDAALFIADNFILGAGWLPLSQVDYISGLL